MNTGIGDAVNLAWKLADVLDRRAAPAILDTYEPERIAFARVLVATTDKLFQAVAGRGIGSRLFRAVVMPGIFPLATRFPPVRRQLFKAGSQIRIKYRHSALSAGHAGRVYAGDRLPWVQLHETDNFEPLESLDWQLHVYGDIRPALLEVAAALGLAVDEFLWSNAAHRAGLKRDALYLVRPDGYVALVSSRQDPQALVNFARRWELSFSGPVG
jgi:hypothetical protein